MSTEELRRAFDALWGGSESRSWVKGRLGTKEADGTIVITAGRPGFVFVRLGAEGDQGTAIARNLGVPLKNYLPVRMRVDPQLGYYVIYSIDYGARYDAFSAGNEKSYNVGPHTHMLHSGLDYPIEALRIDPGRPQCTSALTVSIEQFRYYFFGAWDTWQNTNSLDITSLKPAANKWCWILVGIDPFDNTITAVKGADFDTQAELTDDLIDDIAFVELIPCGAVQVAEADTTLTDIGRWRDARGWSNQPVADLDGVPGVAIAAEAENDSFWYDGAGWVNGVGHRLNMATVVSLELSSGVLDITSNKTDGLFYVGSEVTNNPDTLETITGGNEGDVIILVYFGFGEFITIVDTGNIRAPASTIVLNNARESCTMYKVNNQWNVISYDHRLDTSTTTVEHSLDVYIDLKARQAEQHIHGNLIPLVTGQPLDSVPTDIAFTNGLSKLVIVVNAGGDVAGEITVTGTSVNRNTGAESGADTDTITVDAVTTDDTTTDANGNTVHDFTGAYITSKWFKGAVVLSTVDLTLTDVDVYQVSFEQFGDRAGITLNTIGVTAKINNTAAWCDIYYYLLEVTGDKCDIATIADMHVTVAESTADRYYRLRRGLLAQAIDGTTDGIWIDAHFGPMNQNYWEDINVKLWYSYIYSITPGV